MTKTFKDEIVQPDEKAVLPVDIANDMNLWREGWLGMPKNYIKFHARLALKEFSRISEKYGVVSNTQPYLVSDGWMDGMRVIEVMCERRDGKSVALRWHDGSQRFFIRIPNAGSGIFKESDICPDIEETKSRSAFPWAYREVITF